jgi:hypothetical protein
MDPLVSPDVQITLNALDSTDPFARPNQRPPARPQVIAPNPAPERQRDLSKYEEPEGETPKPQDPSPQDEPERDMAIEDKVEDKPKRGRKPKAKPLDDATPYQNPITESRSAEGLPSYRCEFAGRDIFVGWPWYKTSNPVTAAVNVALALDFGRDKIRFDMTIGDAMVYHSRNKLAQQFLDTEAKWLLMIDDDIIPSIGRPAWFRHWVRAARDLNDAVLQRHVLHRLIGTGKTLVGAAYFGRQEGGRIMCSDLTLEHDAKAYVDRVQPVDWVGTGCMLVHRNVFTAIKAKYPDLAPTKEGEFFDFFRPLGHGQGEDVAFCKRAKEAGHQPHVDLGLPTFHVGYKTY